MLNAMKTRPAEEKASAKPQEEAKERKCTVVYRLRDKSEAMVKAWRDSFAKYSDCVEVSQGDIFKKAPAADALVSPANSFGFMDGGIDMIYSKHFGWQMQDRLQEAIDKEKDGELLVGDALIIPAYGDDPIDKTDLSQFNEGKPIKFLISAPTMRIPCDVSFTANAYLAFRAVILAVDRHNRDKTRQPIKSVLCPGLGTAVGRMPYQRCARQMLMAYETFILGLHPTRRRPQDLHEIFLDHEDMKEY